MYLQMAKTVMAVSMCELQMGLNSDDNTSEECTFLFNGSAVN